MYIVSVSRATQVHILSFYKMSSYYFVYDKVQNLQLQEAVTVTSKCNFFHTIEYPFNRLIKYLSIPSLLHRVPPCQTRTFPLLRLLLLTYLYRLHLFLSFTATHLSHKHTQVNSFTQCLQRK